MKSKCFVECSNYEKHCLKQDENCKNINNFIVKGNWSTWGSWTAETECSNTCGKGKKFWIRERSCTTPKPQCGGDQCDGKSFKYKMNTCNTETNCGKTGK